MNPNFKKSKYLIFLIKILSFVSILSCEKKEKSKIINHKNLISLVTNICDIQNIIVNYIGLEFVEGRILDTNLTGVLEQIEFSNNNKFLILNNDAKYFKLFNINANKYTIVDDCHAISHDNAHTAKIMFSNSKNENDKIILHEIKSGLSKIFDIDPKNRPNILNVKFSNDDKYLLINSWSPIACLYILFIKSGKIIYQSDLYLDFIEFSSTNKYLIYKEQLSTDLILIKNLFIPEKKVINTRSNLHAFSPDEKTIVFVQYDRVKFYNIDKDAIIKDTINLEKYLDNTPIISLSFKDGNYLALGTSAKILIWDINKDILVQIIDYSTNRQMILSQDNRYLAAICTDISGDIMSNELRIWHNLALELLLEVPCETNCMRNILCSIQ